MSEDRYPISVRLIGVMHKQTGKTYITSVLWSDQNEIVVYRSLTDFKKMHKQLKKAFPPTNALKKSSRIIPKFKDQQTTGPQKKGPSRSVLRLKFLEKYCEELLSCDPQVTQSPDLVRFFHPTAQDLQPEYASNSIMVMPADEPGAGERSQDRNHSVGNVTQPFVTETYCCVASYETKDTKNKPFKVALDEKVDVLIKDKAGWWLVENEDKRLAWFPAPYLEKMEDGDDEEDEEDETDSPTGIGALYTVVKNFKSTNKDEVSVNIGSVVEVLQKSDNGWWLVRSGGKVGYVPTLYLQPYNNPRVRMAVLQKDLVRAPNLHLSPDQTPGPGGYDPSRRSRSHGTIVPLAQLQAPSAGYDPSQRRHSQGALPSLAQPRAASLVVPRAGEGAPPPPAPRGNVLQLPVQPPARQRLGERHRARSVDVYDQDSPPPPPTPTEPYSGARVSPLPVILVDSDSEEEEEEVRYRAHALESQESVGSAGSLGSLGSDSEFSFSDDLSSSGGSVLNLNLVHSLNEQQFRMSRTPPPPSTAGGSASSPNRLSPDAGAGKMTPSVSDPNLFKGPTAPRVPPRPRTQEILTRCTTVTRKNASKGGTSASQRPSAMQSR